MHRIAKRPSAFQFRHVVYIIRGVDISVDQTAIIGEKTGDIIGNKYFSLFEIS